MKLLSLLFGALLFMASSLALAVEGLVAVKSPHSVAVTMDRLEVLVKQRDLTVFARIDHAAGASKIGQTLRPTVLSFSAIHKEEHLLCSAPRPPE